MAKMTPIYECAFCGSKIAGKPVEVGRIDKILKQQTTQHPKGWTVPCVTVESNREEKTSSRGLQQWSIDVQEWPIFHEEGHGFHRCRPYADGGRLGLAVLVGFLTDEEAEARLDDVFAEWRDGPLVQLGECSDD